MFARCCPEPAGLERDGHRHDVTRIRGVTEIPQAEFPRVHLVIPLSRHWLFGTYPGRVGSRHLHLHLNEFAFRRPSQVASFGRNLPVSGGATLHCHRPGLACQHPLANEPIATDALRVRSADDGNKECAGSDRADRCQRRRSVRKTAAPRDPLWMPEQQFVILRPLRHPRKNRGSRRQ